MNIYAVLKNDHRSVKTLLEKIEKTTAEDADRSKLFEQLDRELSAHSEAEEGVFYTRLGNHPEIKDCVLESFEEHAVVKTLLMELRAVSAEDETWLPKFTVLKKNVEHHVKEEEGPLFEKARQILSRAEADEIGKRMREKEDQLRA